MNSDKNKYRSCLWRQLAEKVRHLHLNDFGAPQLRNYVNTFWLEFRVNALNSSKVFEVSGRTESIAYFPASHETAHRPSTEKRASILRKNAERHGPERTLLLGMLEAFVLLRPLQTLWGYDRESDILLAPRKRNSNITFRTLRTIEALGEVYCRWTKPVNNAREIRNCWSYKEMINEIQMKRCFCLIFCFHFAL